MSAIEIVNSNAHLTQLYNSLGEPEKLLLLLHVEDLPTDQLDNVTVEDLSEDNLRNLPGYTIMLDDDILRESAPFLDANTSYIFLITLPNLTAEQIQEIKGTTTSPEEVAARITDFVAARDNSTPLQTVNDVITQSRSPFKTDYLLSSGAVLQGQIGQRVTSVDPIWRGMWLQN